MKNIICFLFACGCFAQAGSFDTAFDTDGKSTFCYTPGPTNAIFDAQFQVSGKIVTYNIINGASVASLIRWNNNGSIDTSFGVNGTVSYNATSPFHNNQGYYPRQMAIQTDNKIIIMGLQQGNLYPNAYWVVRLLPDGALDTSFNGTGYLDLLFGTQQDRGTCISLQPDGKILVGGTSGNTAQYFTVARLNSNGTLDNSFGTVGKVQTPFAGEESFAQSIVVQTDGKILLGGYTVNIPHAKDFALIRYNANGSIDTGFGTNGKVVTTISDNSDLITSLIVQPDGKIVAGGFTSSENNPWMCMVRYLANGAVDTTFGVNGIVINNDDNSRNCTIARQVDGKIVMGGCVDGIYFLIIRYNGNGTKDTNFGTNGIVNVFPATYGAAIKILIQPDNKIVACGGTNSPDFTQGCFAVIRLDPGTLGVEEFGNNNVKVYPNPTSGIVSFDNSKNLFTKISVYNCLGQEVLKPFDCTQGNNTVDLSSLTSGVYLLEFKGNGMRNISRVIKE